MKTRFLATLAVLALLTAGTSVAQNLINNSGFEAGTAGWYATGNQDGYTSVNGCSDTTCPFAGNLQAWFGAVNAPGGLAQDVATTAGANYEVSFWLANDGNDADIMPGDHTSIEVTFGGVTLMAENDAVAYGYRFFDFVVTANGPVSALNFSVRQDPYYYYLDQVTVTETPEPASLTLLGSALGIGAGFIRRFRG